MCKSSTLSSMRLLANLLHRIYIYIYYSVHELSSFREGKSVLLSPSSVVSISPLPLVSLAGKKRLVWREKERERKRGKEGKKVGKQANGRAHVHTHCSPLSATRYEIALSGSLLSTREKVFPSSFGGVWRGMAGELGGGRDGRGQHVTLFIGGGRRGMESHVSREIIGLCERVDKWSTAYGASRTTEARFRFHHPLPVIYPHHGGSILFHSALATLGFP